MIVAKLAALLLALTALTLVSAVPTPAASRSRAVRVIPISYQAHDGLSRRAYVIVPADYELGGAPRSRS